MDVLRIGVVGAPRGRSFVRTLSSAEDAKVVSLCDIDTNLLKQVADEFDVPRMYTDYVEMLDNEQLDAVIIATPMHLHVPQSVEALKRGVNVLSEVTAAVSLRQCEELVRACRESDAKYMLAENYCYRPNVVLVQSLVERGFFGRVYFGEGEYIHDVKAMHHHATGQPTWRAVWQVGKRGCTYCTHSLGPLILWFQDRVESVSCHGTGVHTDPGHVMDDTVIMLCKMSKGGLVKIRLDMMSNRPHNMDYYSLQGTKGAYEAPRGLGDDHKIWVSDVSERVEWRPLREFEQYLPDKWRNPPEEARKAGHGGGDYFELRDFLDSVIKDRDPSIDVYMAMDMTLPGLVSERSILNNGRYYTVPDLRTWDGEEALQDLVFPVG